MPDCNAPVMATSDTAYIRFRGSHQLYDGCYFDNELDVWAKKITELETRMVFTYFYNDVKRFAIRNALILENLFKLRS